jgi:hypothetical protein
MKIERIRYAVRFENVPFTDGKQSFWNCQGLPKDPTDFGNALLYPTVEKANHAIKNARGIIGQYGKVVPVKCEFEAVT